MDVKIINNKISSPFTIRLFIYFLSNVGVSSEFPKA